jgi:adenylate cyclase
MPEEQSQARSETRRLAAIMFTDMVGFSRQMGEDEARMLRLLDVHNQTIQQAVAVHHGTVIKTVGDAFLVDFPSVVHAVQCAQQIQHQFRIQNTEKAKDEQIHIRIGIHSGDIVQREGDVFGDGVNIASRLQGLAEPDTTCISDVVYRDVAKKLDLGTVVSLGKPQLKNIAGRFRVYALLPESPKGIRQTLGVQWLKASRRVRPAHRVTAGVVLALIVGGLLTTQAPFFSSIRNPQSPIRNQAALPLPDKPSIVVLPFVNMSGDPGQEYFSDGITEELTASLSRLSSLFVISRNSAFFYKGKAVRLPDLSKELGVQYILEGSVRKSDNQVRITTQLIDATTDRHLWSERYDRPLQDIFALQDEIVQKIVTTLKLQLTLMEQGVLIRKTTDNLEAYDYHLRGSEALLRFTKEGNVQAQQMYEKALALDPQYAQAYALLSITYWGRWWNQWNQDPQTLGQAFTLAQKAVALNDSSPLAHWVLGCVYVGQKQLERAIAEAERAIAFDPNYANAYWLLADLKTWMGRPQEAIESIEKAMRLNPRYPPSYSMSLGFTYLVLKRYDEAIATLKQALSRNPDLAPAHWNLAVAYSELGREEEARAEAAAILRLSPNFSLEGVRRISPMKDSALTERFIDALRKAGLK